MIIIAFDPGKLTGYAEVVFSTFHKKVLSTTLATISIDNLSHYSSGIADVILIEEPPAMAIATDVVWIAYHSIKSRLGAQNIETIAPSQWKPIARARKWLSSGRTNHEQDAYNMIRWYIFKTFKEDIGE